MLRRERDRNGDKQGRQKYRKEAKDFTENGHKSDGKREGDGYGDGDGLRGMRVCREISEGEDEEEETMIQFFIASKTSSLNNIVTSNSI